MVSGKVIGQGVNRPGLSQFNVLVPVGHLIFLELASLSAQRGD